MHGAQFKRRQGAHTTVAVDEACGVGVGVFADAQVGPVFHEPQSAFSVGPVVGPSAFTGGLVGEVEFFDGVFDGVDAVECALDAGVVLGLALAVSLGDVAFALAGCRCGLVSFQPLDAVHEGAVGLHGPVVAAHGLGGHVHGAFCLCAGLVPLHHVEVVHEGFA